MTDPQPIETKNLDGYGHPPLEWSAVLERLDRASGLDQPTYLGTVSPGGRSHATPIGPMWHEGKMYFTSGPGALKSRNLAKNPSCSIAGRVEGMDVVLEGTASIVTDGETLEAVATKYRERGWPAQVENGAFTAPFNAQTRDHPPGISTGSIARSRTSLLSRNPTARLFGVSDIDRQRRSGSLGRCPVRIGSTRARADASYRIPKRQAHARRVRFLLSIPHMQTLSLSSMIAILRRTDIKVPADQG